MNGGFPDQRREQAFPLVGHGVAAVDAPSLCCRLPATPKHCRVMNVIQGMRVAQVAATMRVPDRSIPCFSDSMPTMKPGSSPRYMSKPTSIPTVLGRPKRSPASLLS